MNILPFERSTSFWHRTAFLAAPHAAARRTRARRRAQRDGARGGVPARCTRCVPARGSRSTDSPSRAPSARRRRSTRSWSPLPSSRCSTRCASCCPASSSSTTVLTVRTGVPSSCTHARRPSTAARPRSSATSWPGDCSTSDRRLLDGDAVEAWPDGRDAATESTRLDGGRRARAARQERATRAGVGGRRRRRARGHRLVRRARGRTARRGVRRVRGARRPRRGGVGARRRDARRARAPGAALGGAVALPAFGRLGPTGDGPRARPGDRRSGLRARHPSRHRCRPGQGRRAHGRRDGAARVPSSAPQSPVSPRSSPCRASAPTPRNRSPSRPWPPPPGTMR